MEILLAIVFLLVMGAVALVIQYWPVLLMALAAGGLVGILFVFVNYKSLQRVVTARIIGEEPIIERVSEKTGHTRSYGRYYSYHEHYRDKDAITGYNIKFAVTYNDGKQGIMTCKKGSSTYNKLMAKIK